MEYPGSFDEAVPLEENVIFRVLTNYYVDKTMVDSFSQLSPDDGTELMKTKRLNSLILIQPQNLVVVAFAIFPDRIAKRWEVEKTRMYRFSGLKGNSFTRECS